MKLRHANRPMNQFRSGMDKDDEASYQISTRYCGMTQNRKVCALLSRLKQSLLYNKDFNHVARPSNQRHYSIAFIQSLACAVLDKKPSGGTSKYQDNTGNRENRMLPQQEWIY